MSRDKMLIAYLTKEQIARLKAAKIPETWTKYGTFKIDEFIIPYQATGPAIWEPMVIIREAQC